ncbi:MAG: hypothetical protein ACYS21_04560, partial [Planctomycetota bacterium]
MKTLAVTRVRTMTRVLAGLLAVLSWGYVQAVEQAQPRSFEPFVWLSEPPKVADTWYPSWAADGNLYSPWTDGWCPRLDGGREKSSSNGYRGDRTRRQATTGQAIMIGDDPVNLKIYSVGLSNGDPYPYGGRYPCGSLIHNGVWYYGTYCLAPYGRTRFGDTDYNWPWLGPLVGFRSSTDYGRTWKGTPHTPEKSLFGESGMWAYPVK